MSENKKQKKSNKQITKEYIQQHNMVLGDIQDGGYLDRPFFDTTPMTISVHEKGFDIFTFDESKKKIKNVDSYLWSQFQNCKVDQMAISTRFLLTGENNVNLTVFKKEPIINKLNDHNIHTEYLKRKWFRKIVGFRSGNPFKMIIAVILYIFLASIILNFPSILNGSVFDDSDTQTTNATPKQHLNEPVKKESVKKAEPVKKESAKKPKSVKQIVTSAVHSAFGDKNDFNHKDSIKKVIYNEDLGYVNVMVYGKENLTNNLTKKGMWMSTTNALKKIKSDKRIKSIDFNIYYPLQDVYGNSSDNIVMKISFSRETIDKINFKNFLFDDIPNVADKYWEHPAFNQ